MSNDLPHDNVEDGVCDGMGFSSWIRELWNSRARLRKVMHPRPKKAKKTTKKAKKATTNATKAMKKAMKKKAKKP